eukprot:11168542-Lingulodinium_polyedra.AAC.1
MALELRTAARGNGPRLPRRPRWKTRPPEGTASKPLGPRCGALGLAGLACGPLGGAGAGRRQRTRPR